MHGKKTSYLAFFRLSLIPFTDIFGIVRKYDQEDNGIGAKTKTKVRAKGIIYFSCR